MIRYPTTLASLRSQIERAHPTWFKRAVAILGKLPPRPRSEDFREIWREIKQVYMSLQHSKCAFCEKPLEGSIEQDLEHFRPKAEVHPWTVPPDLVKVGLSLAQPLRASPEPGYRFLAYHPLNYAAACKPCNSVFKKNYFPVVKARIANAKEPPSVAAEKPLLIYPIGNIDVDPETLIGFEGCVPQPRKRSGFGRLRALATIAIFQLADPVERKIFYQGRARAIQLLYLNLEAIRDGSDSELVAAARKTVRRMLSAAEPHCNCLRCFHSLFQGSPAEARQVFVDIVEFLDSNSPSP